MAINLGENIDGGKVAYPFATADYTAHVLDGDYLIAFERGYFTARYFMHPALCEEPERCEVIHGKIGRGVHDDETAAALETHGTTDQVYSDGYGAFTALQRIAID